MQKLTLPTIESFKKGKGPRIEHSFQELGVEMSKYFKENIWFLFHDIRFNETKIKEGFRVCKERGIYKLDYIMGVMSKL